jgi:peptidoglycan hydrolase-like protein with peptidoglycan-binding domain
MEQICADSAYGYDQIERWTGYAAIKKNKNKVAGAVGEFDCSSLIITCYILAGLQMSADGYTGNLRMKLLATGKFKAYTDPAHLTSDKYAKRGGIYIKEGSHVVMALEDGTKPINPYKQPTETIKQGMACEGVMWVQWELREAGYTIVKVNGYDKELKIDGDCGQVTDMGIRIYQRDHELTVDGKVGPDTRKSMTEN